MCIIYLAYETHPDYRLLLLANRDEFYDRPSSAAAFWEDDPNIFAGRDLIAGGTWLGITKSGRMAAVTNFRQPNGNPGIRSRGELVADFLKGDDSAEQYLDLVRTRAEKYAGFNLLVGTFGRERSELLYFSNQRETIEQLQPGIYGLSNHLLDSPWPKVVGGKRKLRELLTGPINNESLFELLADKSRADDRDLPDTGIGYEREKALSAVFIETPGYGTRCSSIVTFDRSGSGKLEERVFA